MMFPIWRACVLMLISELKLFFCELWINKMLNLWEKGERCTPVYPSKSTTAMEVII